jgi:hypothetical protein
MFSLPTWQPSAEMEQQREKAGIATIWLIMAADWSLRAGVLTRLHARGK